MFSVILKNENQFDSIVLQDVETGTNVQVIPSCGAILHAFTILQGEKKINVIDSYTDKAEFDTAFEAKGFKSAKLSPFVCRLKEGEYEFGEKKYKIDKFYLAENAIHGLIYNVAFEIIQQQADEKTASVELLYQYKGTDSGYPFLYNCRIKYELAAGNSLSITTSILNTDKVEIPVCDGWHPYFSFGKTINECQLEFQSKEMLEFDASLIPTGKLIPYQEFGSIKKIGDVFLDNCFTLNTAECNPMLVFREPEQGIQLEVRPDKSYPYLQLYTPPQRQSIAIENLSSAPDAFNNGMGLITLPAGEAVSFTTNYRIVLL